MAVLSAGELQTRIIPPISAPDLLEALESLIWRCLIEKRTGKYTQQRLIMKYVTDRWIEQMIDEIRNLPISGLNDRAVVKITPLDYMETSGSHSLLAPLNQA